MAGGDHAYDGCPPARDQAQEALGGGKGVDRDGHSVARAPLALEEAVAGHAAGEPHRLAVGGRGRPFEGQGAGQHLAHPQPRAGRP